MSEPAAHLDLLERLTVELRAGWQAGKGKLVETFLSEHPDLAADEPSACELIYREFSVRCELGQMPQAADYLRRFPQWAPRLVERFGKHASGSASQKEEAQALDMATVAPEETLHWDADPNATIGTANPSHTAGGDPISAADQTSSPQRAATPSLMRFGDYELIEEIARGGMGVVFKARQVKLNRIVAVKMILAGQLASEMQVRRFYSEAEAAANLDHVGIVPIYEVNRHEGQHYFSMGYVDGASLAERVSQGPLSARLAASLLKSIAEAVHYAHQHGVIHRDLKPQNVLLTSDGQPKVTDFGLAKTVQSDSGLTASGQVLGTPSYMPPEQAAGKLLELGPRSDIYSLGAILYCLITGRPPFQAASMIDTLRQVIECESAAPRQLNPSVDADLETICLKCLQKEPQQRFATAQELADELGRFLAGEPILSRRIGPLARAVRWCRRKPLAAGLAASMVLLAVVLPATVEVARRASRARQVTLLQSQFESQLDRPELSQAYVAKVQKLVDDLALLETAGSENRTQRLTERLDRAIRAAIAAPKLDAAEAARIEAATALLHSRDAGRADALKKALASRMAAWQVEFELRPPFANLARVFPNHSVKIVDGMLRPAASETQAPQRDVPQETRALGTQVSSAGSVRFEAAFDSSWLDAAQIGLRLGDETQHYVVWLRIPKLQPLEEDEPPASAPTSFRALRSVHAPALLEILRNGQAVQRKSIASDDLPAEALEMRVERSREALAVRIGPRLSLEFSDPFPLPANLGKFALLWPEPAALESLRGLRQLQAQTASALERADQLFDAGQYQEALLLYSDPAINAPGSAYRQEARYKQGLCHSELRQTDKAAAIFEPLMAEEGTRWPALAGCRLWLMRLAGGRGSEADTIRDHLAGRFQSIQMGAMIPSDLREPILANYTNQFKTLSSVLSYDPQRLQNLERAAEIDRLLSVDGQSSPTVVRVLEELYEHLGQSARALELTSELIQRDRRPDFLRRYFRLLRVNGRAAEAISEVDRALRQEYYGSPGTWPTFLVERARAQATLENWEQAETDIDRALEISQKFREQKKVHDRGAVTSAFLMKGLLLRRRGHEQAAQAIWRQGWQQLHADAASLGLLSTTTIDVLILGSLTGELTESEAVQIVQSSLRKADSSLVAAASATISPQSMARTLCEMWRSPRGWQMADAWAWKALRSNRVRVPTVLASTEFARQNAFGGQLSREQEEVLWAMVGNAYSSALETGQINSAQVIQLGLAWKGASSLLGWGGLARTLTPELRVQAAYVLAHRNLKLKNRPQAESMLRQIIKDTPPDSPLAKLCGEDLKLIESQFGQLIVRNESTKPVTLKVSQGETQRELNIEEGQRATLDLAPGDYELQLDGAADELSLSAMRAHLTAVGRQEVTISSSQATSLESPGLPGLAPYPRAFPGIGRWQIVSRQLRGARFIHAFSADGAFNAISSIDGVIHVYDLQAQRLQKMLAGNSFTPHDLEFSPDARWLASVSADHTVRIWDLSIGAVRCVLPSPSPVRVAWSPDSRWLAARSHNHTVTIWDTDGIQQRAWEINATGIAFTPDGKHLAVLSNEAIQLLALDEQTPTKTLAPRGVRQMAFHPDGRRLAIATADDRLQLWDISGGSQEPLWQVHRPDILHLAFSRDNESLAIGLGNSCVNLLALSDGAPKWSLAHGRSPVWDLVEREDGCWLAADWAAVRPIQADGTPLAALAFPRSFTRGMILDTARQRIIVSHLVEPHPQVTDWHGQIQTAKAAQGATAAPQFIAAALSPDGKHVVSVSPDNKAWLWETATGVVQHKLAEHQGLVARHDVAYSPDGSLVAIGGIDKRLNVWDAAGKLLWSKTGLPDAILSVTFSPDGRRLLAGLADRDRGIHVFDAGSGQPLQVIRGSTVGVHELVFSPDGRWLAATGNYSIGRLFHSDGVAGPVFTGPTSSFELAWHPNSQMLASACTDGTCRLWDTNGKEIRVLSGPTADVKWIKFNNDGSQVRAATDDGAVRCWDTVSGELQQTLLLLPGKPGVLIDRHGQILSGAADDDLVYLLERPDRGMDVLSPAEFRQRVKP